MSHFPPTKNLTSRINLQIFFREFSFKNTFSNPVFVNFPNKESKSQLSLKSYLIIRAYIA